MGMTTQTDRQPRTDGRTDGQTDRQAIKQTSRQARRLADKQTCMQNKPYHIAPQRTRNIAQAKR
eukprot:1231484-Alexandrium_andersonii.AAC.1